jgi:hypothetical protein
MSEPTFSMTRPPTAASSKNAAKAPSRSLAATVAVNELLHTPGNELDASTRSLMETRFGHDFSRVRVHTGPKAAASAGSLGALAYTIGNDLVFGSGQYNSNSSPGRYLLAHELTHVTQQSGAAALKENQPIGCADSSQEMEALQISSALLRGEQSVRPQRAGPLALARFDDTTHHVIEESALPAAGFSGKQLQGIERGNVQRDYSQVPKPLNAALLGRYNDFGEYKPTEHFDNFIFDTKNDRWRTRGSSHSATSKYFHIDPKDPDPTPVDYISSELLNFAQGHLDNQNLVHLGNALHTVEDFFAHSNFIELTRGDYRFGHDLLTGSYGDDPANTDASLGGKFAAVSTPSMRGYFDNKAESATNLTEPLSHSRMAKDSPSSDGFTQARRLAALVVEKLGAEIFKVMQAKDVNVRAAQMEGVVSQIRTYLRPPDPKNPWWEQLTSQGGASIDARIAEVEKRTPATVNQWLGSPLRNAEASKDSNMAIPLGVALHLGGQNWLQAGGGATRNPALDPRLSDTPDRKDDKSILFGGAQFTGRF